LQVPDKRLLGYLLSISQQAPVAAGEGRDIIVPGDLLEGRNGEVEAFSQESKKEKESGENTPEIVHLRLKM
jgi:hypothetical protein